MPRPTGGEAGTNASRRLLALATGEGLSSTASFQQQSNALLRRSHPAGAGPGARLKSLTAFTLIELLAVVVVITTLLAFIIGLTNYVQRMVLVTRTKADLTCISLALETYKADFGSYPLLDTNALHYPSAVQSTGAPPFSLMLTNNFILVRALIGSGKRYLTFTPHQLTPAWAALSGCPGVTNILDPFGTPYDYFCTRPPAQQINQRTFDLISYGPDHSPNTKDDINNFQR